MSGLINALDNYNPKQIGEKGHIEYGWSDNIQEKILQLSFQLTRTNDDRIGRLSIIIYDLLSELKTKIEEGTLFEKEIAKGHLSILYRMIGHTRDIIDGKGEYKLSYMMVHTWYKIYPSLAQFALKCFFIIDKNDIHQYGSWKDFKYFCEYCKNQGDNMDSPLILYAINLVNEQLKKDYANMISNSNEISLVAKWVPREKSSFGWLYQSLATNYFSEYLTSANTDERLVKAKLKCKTEYRKLLAGINRSLDTTQIKQCGGVWQSIDFNKVTSITLTKQKKAFLNLKKNGEIRHPENNDRIRCAYNFNDHIQKTLKCEKELKGKRVGMADFTKQAVELLENNGTQVEKDILNSQWRDNSSQNGMLGKMIGMVDVSGSMEGDPMNVAIALGIRIAEKSILGKRVMTFSAKPTWVNLDPYPDFVSQVAAVKNAEWGMNTNFYAALNMILDAIVENKMAPEDVQDLILVILSDMQMDDGDKCNKNALYDTMKEKYEAAGIRVRGIPYKPPHILFWNLRSTNGFPTLSNQPNTSMMSGFSPTLLNLFCDQGLNALQSCTPWSLLLKSLENERYKIMSSYLDVQLNI
jgi:hypothetical protein